MRDYIINKLTELGCERENDIFSKTVTIIQPGAQMFFNGRPIQQPPQQIQMKTTVELLEDGYIENEDGSAHENIYWINIKIQQDDDVVTDQTEGLYEDEQNIFDNICDQIFKNS